MRFLVLGTWNPSDSNISSLIGQEQQRTGELMQEGFVEQLFLRADGAGGYMVASADSKVAVQEQLDTLPFMKAGIMQVELVELTG
jgi:Muconolactone delta-isomerase